MNDLTPLAPATLRLSLTSAARALLAFGVPGIAWTLLGSGEIGALAAILATSLVLAAAAWSWLHARRIRVAVPDNATVVARSAWEMDVVVEQRSRMFAAIGLALGVRNDAVPRRASFRGGSIARIAPGGRAETVVRCPPLPRGVHSLGQLEIVTAAPIGLVEARLVFHVPGTVTALPRIGRWTQQRSARELRRRVTVGAGHRAAPEGDVDSLREWRPGESLRTAHWRHSARRGRVLLRGFRSDATRPVHVVLRTDLDPTPRTAGAAFEEAVALAATLVDRHLREGRAVRLTVGGHGTSVACRPGRDGALPALHALARCAPRPGTTPPVLRRAADETLAVVRVDRVDPPARSRRETSSRCALEIDGRDVPAGLDRGGAPPASGPRAQAVDDADRRSLAALAAIALAGIALTLYLVFDGIVARGVSSSVAACTVTGLSAALVWTVRLRPTRSDMAAALWAAPIASLPAMAVGSPATGAAALPIAGLLLLAGLGVNAACSASVPLEPLAATRRRRASLSPTSAVTRLPHPGRSAFDGLSLLPATVLAWVLLSALFEFVRPDRPVDPGVGHGNGGAASDFGVGASRFVVGAAPETPTDIASHDETEELIRVTVLDGGRAVRAPAPLYMRGSIHSEVDAQGTWTTSVASIQPLGTTFTIDGDPAVWRRVPPDRPLAGALRLEVEQTRIEDAGTGFGVLHAPASTAAVSSAAPFRAEDGTLLTDARRSSAFRFGVLAATPAVMPHPTDRSRARRPVGGPAVPDRHVLWPSLREEARAAVARSTTDLARVRSVLDRLRQTHEYDRTPRSHPGPDGLLAFRRDGRGTCVQFAETAAAMLRSEGIQTRVVHGFLLNRFDIATRSYRGFPRNYHAWIEVEFEDVGWFPFDGTPAADESAEGADEAGAENRREGAISTADVVDWLKGHPWAFVASAFVLPIAFLLLRSAIRRRTARRAASVSGGPGPDSDWDRILRGVADRGVVRASAETTTEFAARAAPVLGEFGPAFRAIAARQQEARFGGRPFSDAERAGMREFASRL